LLDSLLQEMSKMDEKYHLTWNEFQSSQSGSIGELLKSEDFTDVTLACEEDKQIKAHKVILSTCSSFFRNILIKNPHPHPLIYVPEVSFTDLQSLMQFMYRGETEVIQKNLKTFMKIGSMLKIKGLVENEQPIIEDDNEVSDQAIIENEAVSKTIYKSGYADSRHLVDASNTVLVKEEDIGMDYYSDTQEGWVDGNEQLIYSSPVDHNASNSEHLKKFSCEKCDYRTRSRGDMKKHVLAIHEGVRYPCDQCSYRATQQGHLKLHKKSKHNNS